MAVARAATVAWQERNAKRREVDQRVTANLDSAVIESGNAIILEHLQPQLEPVRLAMGAARSVLPEDANAATVIGAGERARKAWLDLEPV